MPFKQLLLYSFEKISLTCRKYIYVLYTDAGYMRVVVSTKCFCQNVMCVYDLLFLSIVVCTNIYIYIYITCR